MIVYYSAEYSFDNQRHQILKIITMLIILIKIDEDEENENENENEADENVEARRESFNGSSMHSIMQAVDDLNAEKVSDLLPSDGEEESDEEEKEEEKPVENQAVQGNAENNEYFATVPECPGFHQYVAEEYRPTPFLTRRIMKEWNELKTNLSGIIQLLPVFSQFLTYSTRWNLCKGF